MEQILIVEDNPDYQELLENFLDNAGYIVAKAKDGVEALDYIKRHQVDLILLDIMLPKIDGYGVCELIRKDSNIPIIMLTALDSEAHQIRGYDLQIDEYVAKSVPMPILLHKVAAILRRASSCSNDNKLIYRNITLDKKSHTVSVSGKLTEFTLREFEILQELLCSPGEVISRKALISKLWEYDFYGDERIVDTHIKNIRKKLGADDCIETVRGLGYKLQKEN